MAKHQIKYVPNEVGIREMMQSAEVMEVVEREANAIKNRLNSQGHGTFGVNTKVQRVSAHAYVYTADRHAINAEAKYGLMNKAIGG